MVISDESKMIKSIGGIMLLYLIIWIGCAIACRKIAESKGRGAGAWTAAGLFGGIVALIIIAILPTRMPSTSSNAPAFPQATFSTPQTFKESPDSQSDQGDNGNFNPPKFGQN
jgi:hypothetical protein